MCKFELNAGNNAVKVDTDFVNIIIPRIKEFFKISSVAFTDCIFEIGSLSKSSFSYTHRSSKAVSVDVQNCLFIGELLSRAHHIFVESLSQNNENPKLYVKSCKFSSDKENSNNFDFNDFSNSLVSFDAKNQVFNYDAKNEDFAKQQIKKSKRQLAVIAKVVSIIAAVVLVGIISIKIKKSFYFESEEEDNKESLKQNLI